MVLMVFRPHLPVLHERHADLVLRPEADRDPVRGGHAAVLEAVATAVPEKRKKCTYMMSPHLDANKK